MPGEEPGTGVDLELRDAGVPAEIGVQRLLLGAEGVEQVQGRLPVVPFVVPLQQPCSGMVICRASPNKAAGTKLPANRLAAEMRGSTTAIAGSPPPAIACPDRLGVRVRRTDRRVAGGNACLSCGIAARVGHPMARLQAAW